MRELPCEIKVLYGNFYAGVSVCPEDPMKRRRKPSGCMRAE